MMKSCAILTLSLFFLCGCGLFKKTTEDVNLITGEQKQQPVTSKDRLAQRASLQAQIFTLRAQKMSLEAEMGGFGRRNVGAGNFSSGVSINDLLIRSEILELNHQIQHLEARLSTAVDSTNDQAQY